MKAAVVFVIPMYISWCTKAGVHATSMVYQNDLCKQMGQIHRLHCRMSPLSTQNQSLGWWYFVCWSVDSRALMDVLQYCQESAVYLCSSFIAQHKIEAASTTFQRWQQRPLSECVLIIPGMLVAGLKPPAQHLAICKPQAVLLLLWDPTPTPLWQKQDMGSGRISGTVSGYWQLRKVINPSQCSVFKRKRQKSIVDQNSSHLLKATGCLESKPTPPRWYSTPLFDQYEDCLIMKWAMEPIAGQQSICHIMCSVECHCWRFVYWQAQLYGCLHAGWRFFPRQNFACCVSISYTHQKHA